MSEEDKVREASKRFYAALNSMFVQKNNPMADVWVHDASVTAMHPIGGRQVGWDQVRQSFEQVGGLAGGGEVALRDQIIQVVGDMAYELGIEEGQAQLAGEEIRFDHRVTNIYRRIRGEWKIVHHHADVNAGMVDMLKRLQPAREGARA
jgi:ketosteroid isomerase-like protein